jgi:hypothetical protein
MRIAFDLDGTLVPTSGGFATEPPRSLVLGWLVSEQLRSGATALLRDLAAAGHDLLPPGPFDGVSLVVLPLFLGAFLGALGQLREERASRLATWHGGGVLGLGLAAGRLAVLGTLVS